MSTNAGTMPAIRVAFFDTKPYDRSYFQRAVAGRPADGIELKFFAPRLSADTAALARGFDAVCAFVNDEIDAATADALVSGGVRLVALRCAGYNNVSLSSVWGRLHVVRVPAYSPYAVAEHAAALLLSLNRKIHRAYGRTRDGNFSLSGLVGFDLHGKTAGVVGTGQIGRTSAGILRGFGMELLVSDPYPDESWAAGLGARYVEPEELFAASDVVTLHCPLSAETRHLVDRRVLASMKSRALIVNTGRGELIDSRALIDALVDGRIGGAALDVYEEEDEYFFEDHSDTAIKDEVLARLLSLPNAIVTGHQAFLTVEALEAISEVTLENIRLFFREDRLPNEICYRCTQRDCRRSETGRCF